MGKRFAMSSSAPKRIGQHCQCLEFASLVVQCGQVEDLPTCRGSSVIHADTQVHPGQIIESHQHHAMMAKFPGNLKALFIARNGFAVHTLRGVEIPEIS